MRNKYLQFGLGMMAGALLCGTTATAADYLTARPTTQTFYLNGEKISLTAYLIGGSNYVRLRDIGRAVDFGVTYDGATNSVYIDPDAHYEQEVNQPVQTTPAPSTVTEENVRATIQALRNTYPTGTVYGAFYRSNSNGPYGAAPSNCAGWATLCSDAAFGDLPWKKVVNPSWEQIRPGDLVRYSNSSGGHVVVVLDKTDEYIKVTESGTNNKTRWGGQYFKWWLEEQPGYTLFTRYPQ